MRTIAAKLDSKLARALSDFAARSTGGNTSEAVRLLLSTALSPQGTLSGLEDSLEEQGYDAGLRSARHDALVAMRQALASLWKRG